MIVQDHVTALKSAVVPIDPTLAGAVDTTIERMRDTLRNLHNKVVQAAKRKDDTLRRQFTRTRTLVFPDGEPQERALSVVFFVNRYGLTLGDRLVETLPLATDKHYYYPQQFAGVFAPTGVFCPDMATRVLSRVKQTSAERLSLEG